MSATALCNRLLRDRGRLLTGLFLVSASCATGAAETVLPPKPIRIEAESLRYRDSGGWFHGRLAPGGFYVRRESRGIGPFARGNWVEYPFEVEHPGSYYLAIRHRGLLKFRSIEIDGKVPSKAFENVRTPPPASAKARPIFVVGKVTLSRGAHRLRLTSGRTGVFHLDWMQFSTEPVVTDDSRYDPTRDFPQLWDVHTSREGRVLRIQAKVDNTSVARAEFLAELLDGETRILSQAMTCPPQGTAALNIETDLDNDVPGILHLRIAHRSAPAHGRTFLIGVPPTDARLPRPTALTPAAMPRALQRFGGRDTLVRALDADVGVREWADLVAVALAGRVPSRAPDLFIAAFGQDPFSAEGLRLESSGDPDGAGYICPSAGGRPAPVAVSSPGGSLLEDSDVSRCGGGLRMLAFNSLSRAVRSCALGYAAGAGNRFGRRAAELLSTLARKYGRYRFRSDTLDGNAPEYTPQAIDSASYLLPLADALALVQDRLTPQELQYVKQNLLWPVWDRLHQDEPGRATPPTLRVEMISPHYRNAIFATLPVEEIRVQATLDLAGRILGSVLEAGVTLAGAEEPKWRKRIDAPLPDRCDIVFPAEVPVGSHTVSVRLLGEDGATLVESSLPLHRYAPAKTEVTIDAANFVSRNGQRIFPVGLYGIATGQQDQPAQIELEMRQAVESGINCGIVLDGNLDHRQAFEAATRTGMSLMPTTAYIVPSKLGDEKFRERLRGQAARPETLLWYIADEPDLGWLNLNLTRPRLQRLLAQRLEVQQLDPYHPTWASICSQMALRPMRDVADIIGAHVYPYFTVATDPENVMIPLMVELPLGVRAGRVANRGRKPVFLILPAWDSSKFYQRPLDRRPNYLEQRCMVLSAIAEGARGLIWYVYRSMKGYGHLTEHAHAWEAIKAVGREVHDLHDVVTADDAPLQAEIVEAPYPVYLHHLSKLTARGETWIILANSATRPQRVTLRHPALGSGTVTVWKEDRRLTAEAGVLTDTLPPYGVHIYTTARELPKAPTVDEEQARVARAHLDAEGGNFALRIHGGRTRASWSLWGEPAIDGERHGATVRSPGAREDRASWIQVHLAAEALVDRVIGCGVEADSTFRVQVEVDGEWVQVADRSEATQDEVAELVFSIEPRRTKRIRLLADRQGEFVALREIRVLGKGTLPHTPPYELCLPDYGWGARP